MANTVNFSVKFLDPSNNTGFRASPVEVAIFNSVNVLQETLVFPTGIAETDLGGGDYEYSVTGFDVSDQSLFGGNFISVVWTGKIVSGTLYSDIGQNIPIAAGFVLPTYDEFEEPYATIAFANEFHSLGLDDAAWNNFSDAEKQAALFTASNHIDELYYHGIKFFTSGVTKRQWPRILPPGLFFSTSIEETQLPKAIKKSASVQAFWLLRQRAQGIDIRDREDLQAQGVTGVSRLSSNESWDLSARRRHSLCPEAHRLVRQFIVKGGVTTTFLDGTDLSIGHSGGL